MNAAFRPLCQCVGLLAGLLSSAAAPVGASVLPPPTLHAPTEPTLHIGDAAPELTIDTWVRGEPLKAFEKGRVHLLVFWSSWSTPCVRAVLPLSELTEKHKSDLTVLAVSVAEPRGVEAVREFVAGEKDRINFRVAYDRNGRTDRAWMWASGWAEKEMPAFFVVDAAGKIAWIGSGATRAAAVAERVLAGTFDPKKQAEDDAAAEAAIKARAEQAAATRMRLGEAELKGDAAGVLKAIDELTALDPDSEGTTALTRFTALVQAGQAEKALEYARKAAAGVLKDDAVTLNEIAWMILTEAPIPESGRPVALVLATRASALTKDEDAMILDTYAMACFKTGDKAKALELQRKAVAHIPEDWDDETRDELRGRLAEYERDAKEPSRK